MVICRHHSAGTGLSLSKVIFVVFLPHFYSHTVILNYEFDKPFFNAFFYFRFDNLLKLNEPEETDNHHNDYCIYIHI